MDIRITGSHFDVTEAMRKHVLGKLERVNRHADNIISTKVTLSVDKLKHKAEASVHLAGKNLHVEAVESDIYAAVDVLIDKLDRVILKHNEKSNDPRAIPIPVPAAE